MGVSILAIAAFLSESRAVESQQPEPQFKVEALRFAVVDLAMPVEASSRAWRFRLPADVLFDHDQDRLTREGAQLLTRLAAKIRQQYPTATLRIEGHTDGNGSARNNLRRSERRALAVKKWLTETGGLVHARISTRSFGESQPVAPNRQSDGNDNPLGRQQNRRIEILVERQ